MNKAACNGVPFGPESFVVAAFARGSSDNFARVLEKHGLLAFHALGTRRGAKGISAQHTRLNPAFGLLNFIVAKSLPTLQAESFRFRLFPLFDRWVRSRMRPGQHLITVCGLTNSAVKWTKEHGGKTFIDSINSHPRVFWDLLTEEQKKWGSPYSPVAPFAIQYCFDTVAIIDYVFAISPFVRDSFLEKGWDPTRVLLYDQPLNLDWFKPTDAKRPADRPLTLLNTGQLCLRKGTPYLLEAFRLIRQKEPQAVLRLSQTIRDDARETLRRYADLPIDWSPFLNLRFERERKLYVERFQTSDIFVFPSIEEGLPFVLKEAMACGLPVITTRNSGASDLVQPGENGELVPIRNPEAIAEAVLKWWARIREGKNLQNLQQTRDRITFETFEKTIINHLSLVGHL